MADVGDFTTNPHATIARFGIVNFHYAVWLIAHGALDDIDPPGKKHRRVYRSPEPHVSDVDGTLPAGYPGRRPALRRGPHLR